MADLEHSGPGLLGRNASLDANILASVDNMRHVAMVIDDTHVLGAAIACVGAKGLAVADGRALALDYDGAEHSVQSLAVIHVGRGHDDRQRDAAAVHQQVALATISVITLSELLHGAEKSAKVAQYLAVVEEFAGLCGHSPLSQTRAC